MPKRRNFIEWEVFEQIMARVPRKDGRTEEGRDVVAEVLKTVRGPEWNLDGATNFCLDDVVTAEEAVPE